MFQKSWRGRKGRVYSRQRYKHIVMIQCRVRMWIAKRKLKALKVFIHIKSCVVDVIPHSLLLLSEQSIKLTYPKCTKITEF